MLPSWLSFAIFENNSPTTSSGSSSPYWSAAVHDVAAIVESTHKVRHRPTTKPPATSSKYENQEFRSVSAATSPMSSYAGTPKRDPDAHASASTSAAGGGTSEAWRSNSNRSGGGSTTPKPRRRRSSVFFKLPDLDKINNKYRGDNNGSDAAGNSDGSRGASAAEELQQQQQPRVGLATRRLSRSSFGRSPRRRASIVPASRVAAQEARDAIAPVRAVVNDIVTTSSSTTDGTGSAQRNDHDHADTRPKGTSGTAEVEEESTARGGAGQSEREREGWRNVPRGGLLRGWAEGGAGPEKASPDGDAAAAPPAAVPEGNVRRPRSPRALSEGHR